LSVKNGVCIVDAGFAAIPAVMLSYGFTTSGQQVPLALNLGSYTRFRLNFAGVASSESLAVVITVWPHTGDYYDLEFVLPPNGNPFSLDFPFSSFNNGLGGVGLSSSAASSIDYIVVQAQGGGYASFGITSFEADRY